LDVLREAAIVGSQALARGRVRIAGCNLVGRIVEIRDKCARVSDVKAWILGQDEENLSVVGQSAAEHRLVDKVYPEFRRVAPAAMPNVIPELILLLVAVDRKSGNWSNKLIVAESLKPGSG